ncbi:LicD family protein [Gloeothece verrucosa]|uniref:LicD family protein n=1 Tax=Gloeothece verrucosa (strain PCC 7822) TaxID=497965 RepID=E0UNA8_GLOV7|nr:LicD family protein [Gloeothece verrucosa]ADN18438.1 LicD family protein [Gloeothece verrucosa PCC 7822]
MQFCTKNTLQCELNGSNSNFRYTEKGHNIPVCCATHLVELLFFVTHLLEEHNIPYFIYWGTLLGSIRHSGLIPWDYDVDIGILKDDFERVQVLKPIIKKNGFWFSNFAFEGEGCTIFYSRINHLHLDIEVWEADETYIKWSDYKLLKSEVFPLIKYPFYHKHLLGPNKIDSLLDYYGSDCLEYSYKNYDKSNVARKIRMTDFRPALINFKQNFESDEKITFADKLSQEVTVLKANLTYVIKKDDILGKIIILGRIILPFPLRDFLWRMIGIKIYRFFGLS